VGFRSVKTEWVCFLNDDLRITNTNLLRGLRGADIVGARCSEGCSGFNIIDKKLEQVNDNYSPVKYPSGACLMIKSSVFRKLKGFSEDYINGCEDIDLYLRAEKEGFSILTSPNIVQHSEGSSSNRYDKIDYNIEIFNKKWKTICQI
jgi:GT2 family glycosyltransferase